MNKRKKFLRIFWEHLFIAYPLNIANNSLSTWYSLYAVMESYLLFGNSWYLFWQTMVKFIAINYNFMNLVFRWSGEPNSLPENI